MTTLPSGSPILQNGKLVGAVTHVLINDPTTGYGIFIENMLNAAQMPMAKASEHPNGIRPVSGAIWNTIKGNIIPKRFNIAFSLFILSE